MAAYKAFTYIISSDPRLNHKMQKKAYYYPYVSQAKSKKMSLAQDQRARARAWVPDPPGRREGLSHCIEQPSFQLLATLNPKLSPPTSFGGLQQSPETVYSPIKRNDPHSLYNTLPFPHHWVISVTLCVKTTCREKTPESVYLDHIPLSSEHHTDT